MTNIIQTDPQYWVRRRMYAEIIFLGDNTVGPVAEKLRELGFDLEILDWPDDGPDIHDHGVHSHAPRRVRFLRSCAGHRRAAWW